MITKGLRFSVSLTKYKICESEWVNWSRFKESENDN